MTTIPSFEQYTFDVTPLSEKNGGGVSITWPDLPKPNELFNVVYQTRKKPNAQTLEALNEVGGTSYGSVEALSQLWK